MRIAQVSAHYPPNFVSGGTLVPQRIARLVAAAGHESHVYAGYLDESRAPLETWTQADGQGVEVTWLVTTPWTAWSDPLNFDNPAAAEAFAAWLEQVRPDVVHIHSLQTLGVGLVEAAHRFGAKVVLTMHDFWWFGSRQFLVDHDMRPCSLVSECGSCDCDSAPQLRGRGARLRRALHSADLVLAPSASAARVFAANGVDPDRLRVNENGLPDDQLARLGASPRARSGDGPLRLMYAGGEQEMKGFHILAQAARGIGPREGLGLDAYGVGASAARGLPSWFRAREAFKPEELLEVLEDHDVLVLPSVMRESHSILTREALAAGLAVVCTDTLGPEEAVAEGVNGHVVPAGEPGALAEVLQRLADDPAAARALTGRGSASPIRSLSQQGAELLEIYDELAQDRGTDPSSTVLLEPAGEQPDILQAQAQLLHRILFIVGIDGAPLRYRCYLPAEALALHGHEVTVRHYSDPRLDQDIHEADAVVLYRVPATDRILGIIEQVKARPEPVPVLFDVDDLIFDSTLRGRLDGLKALSKAEEDLWWHGVDRYRTTMEACDGFVGSTRTLCQEATRLTGMPAYRFSNGVGIPLARASDTAVRNDSGAGALPSGQGAQGSPGAQGPGRTAGVADAASPRTVTIGYFSGTTTHDADWAAVEPAVIAVMRRHPQVRLTLGGHLRPTRALAEFGDRVSRMPFTSWLELPTLLRRTDICLAPLTGDSIFNEAKSAIKWLEAALVSRPTIASPTQPFREVIEPGRTGMLASTTAEWEEALEALVSSVSLRTRMGAMARREALLRFSPFLQGRAYRELLARAAIRVRLEGHRADSAWEPVSDPEPASPIPVELDPYGPDVAPHHLVAPTSTDRAKRLVRRAVAMARTEGAGPVLRRARQKVARRLHG
ncbi:glycosyltransferase [Actinomyces bowdenii]|uniref:Glycosyltransferase n=1 Tax=Actinomyces bowdenii TaxID=131109 RepID=A0A3P1UNX4_9ACTO|nr:glycosyltransferase [Actinomyces bowdenii]RRD23664.1 glycosyltransferase [Actinomyces bowdenii]